MLNKLILFVMFGVCFANVDKTIKMPAKPTIITINNNVHQKTQVLNRIEKLFDPLKNSAASFGEFFNTVNKTYLIAGTFITGAIATWSTITTILLLDARFIQNGSNWAYWQGSTPLSLLKDQERKNVAKQLFESLIKMYGIENGDFLTPLLSFMNAIKQEENRYKRFIYWHHYLNKWHITLLFPVQKELVSRAEMHIERLSFYRKILLEWILENKHEPCFL